jgi:basic membrane protein A and related proteins
MIGFEGGVKYWNTMHHDTVKVVGWSTKANTGDFANSFVDPAEGDKLANVLISQGADVVLPVAGLTGNGAFSAAADHQVYAIGVDTDECVSVPEACPVLLTSVLKNMAAAVETAIQADVDGTFQGGVYDGTLANNGVGLAAYHNNAGMVTPATQSELDAIKADLMAGRLDVKAIAAGQ